MNTPDPARCRDSLIPELLPIQSVKWETADTFTLELDATARGGFGFEPGQFNMLYGFGAGEAAISITGDAEHPERLVHTARRVGAVTSVLATLQAGDQLALRGPFGHGWPLNDARGQHLLLVAGGIGLAPLRPVVLHALHHPDEFESVTLVYGARTRSDILYATELEAWSKQLRVEVTVDRGDADWHGHTGVVTKLLAGALRLPAATRVMICGPEIMMRFAARTLIDLGVSPAAICISTERNMKCGVGQCGHCQLGPYLVCRDGPTFGYDRIGQLLTVREL